jgi:hypothetical protein
LISCRAIKFAFRLACAVARCDALAGGETYQTKPNAPIPTGCRSVYLEEPESVILSG